MIKPDFNPPVAQLRQFGFIALFAFPLLSLLVLWRFTDWQLHWSVWTLWGLAGYCGLLALSGFTAPIRIVYIPMTAFATIVGFVLAPVVMGLIYYLLFTPMALWFKIRGRDAMHRTLLPDADTYWTDHRDVTRPRVPSSYMRPY